MLQSRWGLIAQYISTSGASHSVTIGKRWCKKTKKWKRIALKVATKDPLPPLGEDQKHQKTKKKKITQTMGPHHIDPTVTLHVDPSRRSKQWSMDSGWLRNTSESSRSCHARTSIQVWRLGVKLQNALWKFNFEPCEHPEWAFRRRFGELNVKKDCFTRRSVNMIAGMLLVSNGSVTHLQQCIYCTATFPLQRNCYILCVRGNLKVVLRLLFKCLFKTVAVM